MVTGTTSGCAPAPLFRIQNIRTTNVTLPVELILDIVRLAAALDSRAARALAAVCRTICSEVDGLRFRVVRWRYPFSCRPLTDLVPLRELEFLPDNLRHLYWDWSHPTLSEYQMIDMEFYLHWLVHTVPLLRISTLALNITIAGKFGMVQDEDFLEELLIAYDAFWPHRPADLRLPYRYLARLLLHKFPVDRWPEDAVFGCPTLTHLALDALHSQDEGIAQDDAAAIWCFTADALEKLPLLQCFLFILRDDGDLPQFKNADIYADALRLCDDSRVRMDFDSIPCDWQNRWWRSRTQDGGVWRGMGFWDAGCVVPQSLRLAKPPLSHFLLFPYD